MFYLASMCKHPELPGLRYCGVIQQCPEAEFKVHCREILERDLNACYEREPTEAKSELDSMSPEKQAEFEDPKIMLIVWDMRDELRLCLMKKHVTEDEEGHVGSKSTIVPKSLDSDSIYNVIKALITSGQSQTPQDG